MAVSVVTPTQAAQENARKRKVSSKFNISAIEQELKWRGWFPSKPIDWSQDIDHEDALMLAEACTNFLEENMWIRVPGKGRVPLKLRAAQREVLYDWIRYRRNVVLKARQIGFSTLIAGFTLWLTYGWDNRQIIMLSKGEREAVSLLLKAKQAYKHFPDWVRMRGPRLMDRVRTQMTFENDSTLMSLPSANNPARGESVFLAILDEWAFLPNPEEAWASVEPTTDIGGRVLGLSTANGEGTFFHRTWVGSQLGENGFHGIFFPWSAVEERTLEWYAQKQRELEPWQLCQEYPSNPEEAFIGSGNPFFNLKNLARFKEVPPVWVGTIALEGKEPRLFEEDGPLKIWATPNDENRYSYVIGADIAQGLEHGDYSVAYVLCVQTNEIVAMWHGHIDPDIFGASVLPALGWYYRFAVIAPEFNNHGMTTTKALQRVKYNRIYRRRSLSKRQDRPLEQLGWLTTQTSKPLLADDLAAWLREAKNVPDRRTIAELRTFTRDEKGKLSGSPHDDCVMALGIAIQCRKYAIIEKIQGNVSAEKVKGSFAWWEKKLDGAKRGHKNLKPTFS